MSEQPDPDRVAAQRERDAAAKRAWHLAHPDYKREWNAANRARINERARNYEARKRAAARRHAAALERGRVYREAHRVEERERSRRFREQHPERVREYARRYKERHPDRYAEQQRRAQRAYTDRNAATHRETNRKAAAARRQANPDVYRDWYQANLERERARGRAASRLRARLTALGLPPRQVHRSYANEKRAHDVDARAFFTRPVDTDLRNRVTAEAAELGRLDRLRWWDTVAHGDDPRPHPREVARFQHASAVYRLRHTAKTELPAYVADIARRHGNQIREDVRLDAVARNARRGPPLDELTELIRHLRTAALHEFHADHHDLIRAASAALTDALHLASDADWWVTADRPQVRELWDLAHTGVIGEAERRDTLRRLIDTGTRTHHGLPAPLYIAGHTAADLPRLRAQAEARRAATTPHVTGVRSYGSGIGR